MVAFVVSTLLYVTPAAALHTTVGGRAVDLDATFSVREVIEEDRATTHERTLEQLHLRSAIALSSWLRFEAATTARNGGPTMKSNASGLYNLDDVFQDRSPSVDIEEGYFDVTLPAAELRLGMQKVAWGKLDRFQPNDLINPLSYLDPFLQEEMERKIGVAAAQASYFLPNWAGILEENRLTTVWVPRYVPYRFGAAGCAVQNGSSHCNIERWYPPAAVPPTSFTIPPGIIPIGNGALNPAINFPLGFRTFNAAPPAFRLENSEIGLRYGGLAHGLPHDVDFALYYFHGFDVQPTFLVTAEASGIADPDPSNPIHVKNLSASTTVAPDFHHIDAGGADWAYATGPFTFRGEGAFVSGRPFPRDLRGLVSNPGQLAPGIAAALDALGHGAGHAAVPLPPSVVVRDAFEWGVGGDYVYAGYLLLLQVNQTDVLHNNVQLLIKDAETRLLMTLRKNFLSDRVQTQIVALQAVESDYTLLRPRLTYRITDQLAAEIGYLFIAGRSQSVIGQYHHNDEGWTRLEWRI